MPDSTQAIRFIEEPRQRFSILREIYNATTHGGYEEVERGRVTREVNGLRKRYCHALSLLSQNPDTLSFELREKFEAALKVDTELLRNALRWPGTANLFRGSLEEMISALSQEPLPHPRAPRQGLSPEADEDRDTTVRSRVKVERKPLPVTPLLPPLQAGGQTPARFLVPYSCFTEVSPTYRARLTQGLRYFLRAIAERQGHSITEVVQELYTNLGFDEEAIHELAAFLSPATEVSSPPCPQTSCRGCRRMLVEGLMWYVYGVAERRRMATLDVTREVCRRLGWSEDSTYEFTDLLNRDCFEQSLPRLTREVIVMGVNDLPFW